MKISTLAVVGVGLIGGSFAAALKRAGMAQHVLGVGRHAGALRQALELGLIDEAASIEDAARRADFILLATPVGSMVELLIQMRPHLRPDVVLTDAGSTKAGLARAARGVLGEAVARFVPGHPIAGAEQSGPRAARADLFDGKHVLLTPLPENAPDTVAAVRAAWQACGAALLDMDAKAHDEVFASVSHLPHWLAFAYVEQVSRAADADRRLALAGTGFRDFTRIAASSPEMWRDVFIANRMALRRELDALQDVLDQARGALDGRDAEAMLAWLRHASDVRRNWNSGTGPSTP